MKRPTKEAAKNPPATIPADDPGLDLLENFVDATDELGRALRAEMDWLATLIDARIRSYFGGENPALDLASVAPPEYPPGSSRYADLIARMDARIPERVLLALALAPHIAPQVLDVFFLKNEKTDRGFTEFGGVKGVHHAGFLPTGETALFLLCGDSIERRLDAQQLFEPEHPLFRQGVLRLATPAADEPAWTGALSFSAAFLRHLITGEEPKPELGPAFPARPITTRLAWSDLVLEPQTMAEIREISAWARHRRALLDENGFGRHLKPGYRALFHGPSGTGKTLTASLLGKELGVEVYRIDLSQVVSKYIGETEKNLSAVFSEAERRSWILFFDEADALFGKRTQTSSAHDRYANQEVSYLLQRVEEHPGIVILASNLKSNLDEAFARRFQSTIYFAPPNPTQRLRLWKTAFGPKAVFNVDVDLAKIARDYELTGGQIVNIALFGWVMALEGDGKISRRHIEQGAARENQKMGRAR